MKAGAPGDRSRDAPTGPILPRDNMSEAQELLCDRGAQACQVAECVPRMAAPMTTRSNAPGELFRSCTVPVGRRHLAGGESAALRGCSTVINSVTFVSFWLFGEGKNRRWGVVYSLICSVMTLRVVEAVGAEGVSNRRILSGSPSFRGCRRRPFPANPNEVAVLCSCTDKVVWHTRLLPNCLWKSESREGRGHVRLIVPCSVHTSTRERRRRLLFVADGDLQDRQDGGPDHLEQSTVPRSMTCIGRVPCVPLAGERDAVPSARDCAVSG